MPDNGNNPDKNKPDTLEATIKKEFEEIKKQFTNTNANIKTLQDTINGQIKTIRDDVTDHNSRITKLEGYAATDGRQIENISHQLELLKQDRLRNNLRLTGLPPLAFDNIQDTIVKILNILKISLLPSDFVAYSDRNRTSIILSFGNYTHKRYFMDTLRKKDALLVEEVLQVESNARIFCNDQLTPYFASLFQTAWQAKKTNKIHAASSLGGRIRIRKTNTSEFILIQSPSQLDDIIESGHSDTVVEIANQISNESPSSASIDRSKPEHNSALSSQRNPTSYSNRAHQHNHNLPKAYKTTTNRNNTHRSNPWVQRRSIHTAYNDQDRINQRYKQQDIGRRIDLSPNQYQTQNTYRSSHSHPLNNRHNQQAYSNGRY